MYTHRPLLDEQEDQETANRQTASLCGIAITLILLVAGLFLVQQLRSAARIEDCLLAGRQDCDVLVNASQR